MKEIDNQSATAMAIMKTTSVGVSEANLALLTPAELAVLAAGLPPRVESSAEDIAARLAARRSRVGTEDAKDSIQLTDHATSTPSPADQLSATEAVQACLDIAAEYWKSAGDTVSDINRPTGEERGRIQAATAINTKLQAFWETLSQTPTPAPISQGSEAHPDDLAVDRFTAAMKAKLAKKRDEGYSGWEDAEQCSMVRLLRLLEGHILKGDPIDVSNIAMMIHQRAMMGLVE